MAISTLPVVHLVAGARPNFMKIAPLFHVLQQETWCAVRIVHTGQHYDENMSDNFFRDLGLPRPNFSLDCGSGTHAEQTAVVLTRYEEVCQSDRPDWTIVVGDVNSTLAGALAATKLRIPVAHLEAGLRSGDRSMPEEINRILTDVIADLLWTPSADADDNLIAEGIPADQIERVGNIMIDSLEMLRPQIAESGSCRQLGLSQKHFGVVTLHRPSNVDDRKRLSLIVDQLVSSSQEVPLVLAVHPRTGERLKEFGLQSRLNEAHGLHVIEPMAYIGFMSLVFDSQFVVTDSGGLQEETTYLGIPCVTVRENTERPITVTKGTNRLAQPGEIADHVIAILKGNWPKGTKPDMWDGRTAKRIANSLKLRIRCS